MQPTPVFLWGKNFIDKLDLNNAATILDVGCRKGDLSVYLAKRYPQKKWIGIDNIASNIEQTKTHQLPNLTFATADALHLDFSNTFDTVISLSCLHWIKNKYTVLENIYQALKPGGKAYLQFFVLHGRPKNDRFIYQTARSSDWKRYFNHCYPTYSETTPGEFLLMLQKAGFIIYQLELSKYNTLFEHADSLRGWLSTWASQAVCAPKRKRDHFLNDVVCKYLDFHQQEYDTPFPYYEYLLEVICEKPLEPFSYHTTLPLLLTKREQEILKNYLQGKTAKEIAKFYAISAKTVEFHLANMKKKLNCYRRSDIHQAILDQGLIDLLL